MEKLTALFAIAGLITAILAQSTEVFLLGSLILFTNAYVTIGIMKTKKG